jgi:hypothetical protein
MQMQQEVDIFVVADPDGEKAHNGGVPFQHLRWSARGQRNYSLFYYNESLKIIAI